MNKRTLLMFILATLFLDELLKLNNDEDVDEVVSSDFIDYVRDNMDGISDTFQNNLLAGIIDEQIKNNGNGPIKNSDLIKAMQSNKPGSGFFRNQGKWILNIGESIGRTLTTMTVGVGVYIDYTTTSMTLGQSSIKNWADGIITATFSGVSYHGVFTVAEYLSLTNPVGLGILASIGTATIVSTGFNYAYNNNYFWLKTGVDWTG